MRGLGLRALLLAAVAWVALGCAPWPTTARRSAACGDEGQRCCENESCRGGRSCVNGACALCRADQRRCGDGCIPLATPCGRGQVDVLFVVDNSNSMGSNQAALARNFGAFADALARPPVDPMTGLPFVAPDLHIGVVSTDLGTPGSVVPSCANGEAGDDGLLNPIGNGRALAAHQPWTTAPPGERPTCSFDVDAYPDFLRVSGASAAGGSVARDFVCSAYLSVGGCGLEQPLEAAYRALVVHGAGPNAGFLRAEAVLVVVLFTDEEDGSVRDCRYAEADVPCADATGVFDVRSPQWSSSDLNLRMYMYTPGSAQDPTWPVDRYVDPARLSRGFPSLKPGRPERVIFAAVTGTPITPPRVGDGIDWDTLLGRNPDGSDGLTAASAEGPVSMRQRNMDPLCRTRVVPACRREGSMSGRGCEPSSQYFAWPARRIARVTRAFEETWGNGVLTSICKNDYAELFTEVNRRVFLRLAGR